MPRVFIHVITLIAATLLSGCVPRQHIAFTIIEPGQGVRSSGGGTILNDFTPEIVQHEAAAVKLYYERCQKLNNHCGCFIEFRYDDRVSQAKLEEAITVTVTAFHYAQPIYVRVVDDDHPRGIPLYANVSVGQIELVP